MERGLPARTLIYKAGKMPALHNINRAALFGEALSLRWAVSSNG